MTPVGILIALMAVVVSMSLDHGNVTDLIKLPAILLVLGGTIPDEDQSKLKANGVSAIFGPGTPLETTITFIRENVKPRTLAL